MSNEVRESDYARYVEVLIGSRYGLDRSRRMRPPGRRCPEEVFGGVHKPYSDRNSVNVQYLCKSRSLYYIITNSIGELNLIYSSYIPRIETSQMKTVFEIIRCIGSVFERKPKDGILYSPAV